jgi:hypothetical protein
MVARQFAVRSVPATSISPYQPLPLRKIALQRIQVTTSRRAFTLIQDKFLRDNAFKSILSYSTLSLVFVDLPEFRPTFAWRDRSGSSANHSPGPELRGQVRLIKLVQVSDELWQRCCPALYPAEVGESQEGRQENLLHHPIRSLFLKRCGLIHKPEATKKQRSRFRRI